MPCDTCPAAFVIDGATPIDRAVLCRVESTEVGQQSASLGPLAMVRERESPASLHGFCLGDLPEWSDEILDLRGLIGASDEQRKIALAARRTGSDPSYRQCPSWRAEYANRHAAKLVDLPGEKRVHRAA